MKFFALALFAVLAQQVNAHGYLSQPAATFKPDVMGTSYITTVTASIDNAFAGKKWDDNPTANAEMFKNSVGSSQYKSLRALIDQFVPDCGNTVTTGAPVDVSSLSSMKWQNDQEQMGFVSSHHGPCEAWIGDTMVFHSDDCSAQYTAYPAEIPIDFSKCSGTCTFTFYWMAMHQPEWQLYKNCAPIQNGGGEARSVNFSNLVAGEGDYSPEPTTAAPTSTTPESTTAAPSTTAPPAAGTVNANCARRLRGRRMTAN